MPAGLRCQNLGVSMHLDAGFWPLLLIFIAGLASIAWRRLVLA